MGTLGGLLVRIGGSFKSAVAVKGAASSCQARPLKGSRPVLRFYTLLVLATALFGKPPFKNVIVNGLVLARYGDLGCPLRGRPQARRRKPSAHPLRHS